MSTNIGSSLCFASIAFCRWSRNVNMRSSDVLLVLGGACTSVFVTAYMFFTKIKGSPKKS